MPTEMLVLGLGAVLLLPWAVAPVVTGVFWRFIFTSRFGLASNVATAAGFDAPNWLESTATSIAIGINATAWRSVPLAALLLLAALKQVPTAQFRAARMDGASTWQAARVVSD